MERKNRTAIYARCSTVHQSLDVQLSDLNRYADARGFDVVEIYKDHGVSGTRDSRPALDRLLKAARRREFSHILIWRLDRLGRNVSHLLGVIEEFNALGVTLISHQEAFDLSSPIGKAMVIILSALSAFENDVRRERIMAGIQHAKSKGKKLGRPRSVDREQVRQLRNQGLSYKEIQSRLGIGRGPIYRALQDAHQNIVA